MTERPPIVLVVEEHPNASMFYRVGWTDGEPLRPIENVPEILLDLTPYIAARKLLAEGYHPERMLIIQLRGADYELMHAPLGIVAATPVLNAKPVTDPARSLYLKRQEATHDRS
jgi:hypothetical protein